MLFLHFLNFGHSLGGVTMYDVTIIGAGVVGASIARELSRYKLKTLVLEKNIEVCQGTTKANSAIVHGGYDAHEGSLKAKLNVWGNKLYSQLTEELEVSFDRIGSLVVAFNEEELKELEVLYKRGIKNQVEGLELVDGDRARELEPNLSKEVIGALYCSSAGIVCPFNMTFALIENAIENNVELKTSEKVESIEKLDEGFKIRTSNSEYKTKYIVNAAGLYSDKIANLIGDNEFEILPRKGEYRILDRNAGDSVTKVIFQAPTKVGKGILVAPTVHGNVIVGPTADNVDSVEDTRTSSSGIEKVDELSRKSIPNLPLNQSIRVFAGVRASSNKKDFVIYPSKNAKGFINVGGIDSPGLASSPAIAKYVAKLLNEQGLELEENPSFNPKRKAILGFEHMSLEEKKEILKQNSKYSKIICRCESITEGEIIEAIKRPAGARTLDGVKRRVRPGSGRCQGGFCAPRVMEILSRELNIPIEELVKENHGSTLVDSKIKGGDK